MSSYVNVFASSARIVTTTCEMVLLEMVVLYFLTYVLNVLIHNILMEVTPERLLNVPSI